MKKTVTITRKLAGILIINLLIITGVSSLYVWFSQKNKLSRELELGNSYLLERLSFVLAEPLSQLDLDRVEKLVLFEMQEEKVASLLVLEEGKSFLLGKTKKEGDITDFNPSVYGYPAPQEDKRIDIRNL